MTEEKLVFLRAENCGPEELESLSDKVEKATPENYNFLVVDEGVVFADPDEMMEMFLSMFHFIEAECYKDEAEAKKAVNPEQENLRNIGEKYE